VATDIFPRECSQIEVDQYLFGRPPTCRWPTSPPIVTHCHWSARFTWPLYNQLPFRARLTYRPDDGGSTHLWNLGRHLFDDTAVHPRILWTSMFDIQFL